MDWDVAQFLSSPAYSLSLAPGQRAFKGLGGGNQQRFAQDLLTNPLLIMEYCYSGGGKSNAKVNTFKELFAHPQIEAMGIVKELEDPVLGKVACVVAPWKMDGVSKPSPVPYQEPTEF